MKPLAAKDIHGNWATLLSVWNTDGTPDYGRIGHEIDVLITIGVDGIYSNGTAGEFHTQTDEEFIRISELLAGKCNDAGMPFQLGVSHMSAQISLERLRKVVSLAPSALQVILPDWFPVSQAEALVFLERMAENAGGIGLVLYNPPHAKRRLSTAELGFLADRLPALVGLKTAGGDDSWYEGMRAHIPGLSVFIPGHLLASGFRRGATGAYSNVACLNPAAAQHWYDQMQTDMEAALELESRLCQFMDQHIVPLIRDQGFCNAACDRLMAVMGAWADVGTEMRWPYRSIPVAEAQRLRPLAKALIPEFIGS